MVFRTELEQLLRKAVVERVEIITQPHAVVDFAAYKHHVGVIEGLKMALELCDEAETIINKRERGA